MILRLSNVNRTVFCNFASFSAGENATLAALIPGSPVIRKFGDSWKLGKMLITMVFGLFALTRTFFHEC